MTVKLHCYPVIDNSYEVPHITSLTLEVYYVITK